MKIGERPIGETNPLFFIAEAGVNHNGSIELAKQLVDVAVDSGADAIKFQTFNTTEIVTKTAPKSEYHVRTTGNDKKQSWFDLLKSQEMSIEMHKELIEYCNMKNIIFLSTPYDEKSVDLLHDLNIPAFKIASTDANNLPFIKYVAKKRRPILLSTAMCNMQEVETAVNVIRTEGLDDVVIFHCTGNYPASIEDSNLLVIKTFIEQLRCIVGYSDHTKEIINPIASVVLGASVYEKHFTIDNNLPGPDHLMSLSPSQLKETIMAIRLTEKALGNKEKVVLASENENRLKLRKSLVAAREIKKGELITESMIAIKRPGYGLEPNEFKNIVGSSATVDITEDTLLGYEMFSRDR